MLPSPVTLPSVIVILAVPTIVLSNVTVPLDSLIASAVSPFFKPLIVAKVFVVPESAWYVTLLLASV